MGKVITVACQKGGTGKTTTTFNLAYALHKMGYKVLTIDFDSQANLTACYGVNDIEPADITIATLMLRKMNEEKMPAPWEYIHSVNDMEFVPSSIELSLVDAKLRLELGAETMLSELLKGLKAQYDFILIDTCPSLGSLTINALVAADEVIVPVNAQLLAMMGLQDFMKTVQKIRRRVNPKLQVAGILLTMCDARTVLHRVIFDQVSEAYAGKINVYETQIPQTVKVGESIYYGKPIAEYCPSATAGIAYGQLAKEFVAYES